VLGVCKVLDSPLVLLGILVLNCCLFIIDLAFALLVDSINLAGAESFKVIGHVSVRSKLGSSSREVFSHDVTHVCTLNFNCIQSLLLDSPLLLASSLFICQSLVISLKFLDHLLFLHSCFIFEHSPHSSDAFSLGSPLTLFFDFVLHVPFVLALLLLDPFLLDSSVGDLTVSIGLKRMRIKRETYQDLLPRTV
jgi:hypothetical protein